MSTCKGDTMKVGRALFILVLASLFAADPPESLSKGKGDAKAQYWAGTLSGEFIGDTSGDKVARVFVPTVRIRFTVRIAGRIMPSGRFEGSYDAVFIPEIKTIDLEKAKEVDRWEVKTADRLEAQGRVTGRGPYNLNDRQKDFIKNLLKALEKLLEKWKLRSAGHLVKSGTLDAVTAIIPSGGIDADLDVEELKEILAEIAGDDYADNKEQYDQACDGITDALNASLDNGTAQPMYPSAAAFPGPLFPPTPNIPMPLIVVTGGETATSESILAAMGGESNPDGDIALTEALAEVMAGAWTEFAASNMIQNLMGTGPVPTFAPPLVPVGAVQGGSLLGGELAGPTLTRGNPEDLISKRQRMLKLCFHGMPTSIPVSILGIFHSREWQKTWKRSKKTGLGLGYFSPGARIFRSSFEAQVSLQDGILSAEADFNDDRIKPSRISGGTLREIAKTRLVMCQATAGRDLPPELREKLGLTDNGEPPRGKDGKVISPAGHEFNHFALIANLSLSGGDGSHDAGQGGMEVASAQGPNGGDAAVVFFNSRKTPLRDTGLYMLIEVGKNTALRVTAGGEACTGLVDGRVLADLPRSFGHVTAGQGRYYLTTAQTYSIHVPATTKDVRLVVPSSPWTRRTFRFRPGAPTTLTVDRTGKVSFPPGLKVSCTEDADGRYRGRKVDLKPKPVPPAEAPAKAAPKKTPKPKAKKMTIPHELTWPPGIDPKGLMSSKKRRRIEGRWVSVSHTFHLTRILKLDREAVLAHYRGIFAQHEWKGKWDENPRVAFGKFKKSGMKLEIQLMTIPGGRSMFRFQLEIPLTEKAPAKKTPKTPAKTLPKPSAKTPAEKEKPLAKNEQSPAEYCEMTGKVILALAPLVVKMKEELKGASLEKKMEIGMRYGKLIKAASEGIYAEYGVTKSWADRAPKQEKYKKAFEAYLTEHPDVKKALDAIKG
jgi:hypothetical protein